MKDSSFVEYEVVTWCEETLGMRGLKWDFEYARTRTDAVGKFTWKAQFKFKEKEDALLFLIRFGGKHIKK